MCATRLNYLQPTQTDSVKFVIGCIIVRVRNVCSLPWIIIGQGPIIYTADSCKSCSANSISGGNLSPLSAYSNF